MCNQQTRPRRFRWRRAALGILAACASGGAAQAGTATTTLSVGVKVVAASKTTTPEVMNPPDEAIAVVVDPTTNRIVYIY